MDFPFPYEFSRVLLFCRLCLPPDVHLPPPSFWLPPHRAGRSVFSAMKLGKNRPHKEEPQRQGMDACPRPRSSSPLSPHLPGTKPRLSAGSGPLGSPAIGQRSHLGGAWPPIGCQRNPVLRVVVQKGALRGLEVGTTFPPI